MRLAAVVWLPSILVVLGASAGPAPGATVSSLLIDGTASEAASFYYYGSDTSTVEDSTDNPSTPGEVILSVTGPHLPPWILRFKAPAGEVLHPGNYDVPLDPSGASSAILVYDPRVGPCYWTKGRIGVNQVLFDASGRLEAFWALFTHTCGNQTLVGEVRFNAGVRVVVEAPSYQAAAEGHPVSFKVSAHDAAGNPAALILTRQPAGASLSDAGDGTGTFSWTPAAGQAGRYWMQWTGQMPTGEGDLVYTLVDVYPDLDEFDHAIPFSTVPFFRLFDAPILTAAPDDPVCGREAAASAWFEYTPAQDGRIQLYTQADVNESYFVSFYEGERGDLRPLACDLWNTRVDVVAGRVYHVMIGLPEPTPRFYLRVDPLPTPPANDDLERATVVTALPFHEAIEAGGARPGAGDPPVCHSYWVRNPNVWYTYAPVVDTRVTVDIPYDETTIFRGPKDGLVPIACGHDAPVTFTARAGETYHVMTSQPIIPLSWPISVTMTGRPAFGFGVSIDPRNGTRGGGAVVRGTATCERPAHLHLSGDLQQSRGPSDRNVARGHFETDLTCNGPTPWSATVVPFPDAGGRRSSGFRNGAATLSIDATGAPDDEPDDLASRQIRGQILLKTIPAR